MLSKRVCWPLLLTAMLAVAAQATRIQAIETAGENTEQQEAQIAERGSDDSDHGRGQKAIVGAWFGTTGTGLKQLYTFHADGTAFRSVPGEVSIAPARPPHTLTHGVWRYLGHGRFGVTMWDIFYDVNTAQLIQYTKVRLEVTLGDDRDEASARAKLEFLDPQGAVLRTVTGTTSLVRIPYEPLE